MLDTTVAFRAFIRLSETREVEEISSVCADVLREIILGDFALYIVREGGRSALFELASGFDPFGEKSQDLLALFNNKSTGIKGLYCGEIRPIPVATGHGLHAVLLLERKAKIQDEVFLNAFLSIYANQFFLVKSSSHDALTGLMNRGEFDEKLYKLLEQQAHHQRNDDQNQNSACLGVIDIDHFKQVNDRFGHVYGDEVLLLVAQQMTKTFREDDWLFRYGGEEFTVILRNVTEAQCVAIFERVRKAVEAFHFPQVGALTVSIGYTRMHKALSAGQLIGEADSALYYAKKHGRNQLHCYQKLVNQGELHVAKEPAGEVELF